MSAEELTFAATFAAGFWSFASPCVLPLVPGYIGYLLTASVLAPKGAEVGAGKKHTKIRRSNGSIRKGRPAKSNPFQMRATRYAVVFVFGFSLSFIAFMASLKAIHHFLPDYVTFGRPMVGVILIILGLKLVGILKIPSTDFSQRTRGFWKRQGATLVPATVSEARSRPGLPATFLIGMLFSAGWTPCVGPVLSLAIERVNEKDTVWQGVYLLGGYSLGLATPFLVIGSATALVFTGLLSWTEYTRAGVRAISGLLLSLVGALMLFNLFQTLPQFFNWEVLARIGQANTFKDTNPTSIAQPQPLLSSSLSSSLSLIKLQPTRGSTSLDFFRQLAELEPIKAGRFQPVDYTPPGIGTIERILAVVSSNDEDIFAKSGVEYSRLDREADTVRYFSLSIPAGSSLEDKGGQPVLDEHWQVLERSGNRLIFKAEIPLYLGLGPRSKLVIEKLPPRIHLPGLTAACPCPALIAFTFPALAEKLTSATNPALTASSLDKTLKGSDWLKRQLEKIDEERFKQLINQISQNSVPGKGSLNTRYTGSAGSVYFAERLYTYFFALGLKVEYDNFVEVALGTLTTNVVAQQPAERSSWGVEPVLLIAHYDSIGENKPKGISNATLSAYGANDNGVGVAGLIEVARLLSSYRFKEPIRYIAFGAEEQGLLGSQHYVEHQLSRERLSAVINLDSFGYNTAPQDQIFLGYGEHGAELKETLLIYAKKYEIDLLLQLRQGEPTLRSDDYTFDKLGYKAVVLTDSSSGLNPVNHGPGDGVNNLNFKTVRKVAQLTLVAVAELAGFVGL